RRRADVVRHAGGARGKYGDVSAALALELELRLHARAHLVVAELEHVARRRLRRALQGGDLALAKLFERFRRGGVMAAAVDDGHGDAGWRLRGLVFVMLCAGAGGGLGDV